MDSLHGHAPLILALGRRKVISELKSDLVYTVSSSTARATYYLKNKQTKTRANDQMDRRFT